MPTDLPDGGLPSYQNAQAGDLGIIADRVLMGGGSQNRQGRLIWATGFEADPQAGPINLTSFYSGSGNGMAEIVSLAQSKTGGLNNSIWQGNQAMHLQTGAVSGDNINVFKMFPFQAGKIGLECMINFPLTNPANLDLIIELTRLGSPAGFYQQARFLLEIVSVTTNDKLYRDNNGTRTLLKDVTTPYMQGDTRTPWHYMKLTADPVGKLFGRAYFDDLIFDLSAVSLFQGSTTSYGDRFLITLLTNQAAIADCWIDNLIFTADEP